MATVTTDITILMSTYNRRKYLPSMLKDLQAQTFSNWRLIIVNDGGDDVEDIVKGFNDDRMEYYNRPHLGKPAQLNFALRMVKSKYIGYLDDDDNMLPEHFSLLYETAEKNNVDFVYTNVETVILDNNEQIVERRPVDDSDVTWEDIRIQNRINHSTILHTKSLSDKVGDYDERMKVLIDYDYIKRLVAIAKPIHIHAATYKWNLRKNAEGHVRSISGLWDREPEAAGRSLLAFFGKDPSALSTCYLQWFRLKQDCDFYKQREEREHLLSKEIEHLNEQIKELQEETYWLYHKKRKHIKTIRSLTIALILFACLFIFIITYFFIH